MELKEKIGFPKAIIGLGNPGSAYKNTRHNIGFKVLDAIAQEFFGDWRKIDNLEYSKININNHYILLIKPQTFMNNSGKVVPFLQKKGIRPENTLIVHDELEFPLGKFGFKFGGSARGHNGLKSFISFWGDKFSRFRIGIGRPENKEDVPNYVLQEFKEPENEIQELISKSVDYIKDLYKI